MIYINVETILSLFQIGTCSGRQKKKKKRTAQKEERVKKKRFKKALSAVKTKTSLIKV